MVHSQPRHCRPYFCIAEYLGHYKFSLDLGWRSGNFCKIQCFWIEACYTTSIMTLVLISFQRIKAVLHPFNAQLSDAEGAKRKVVALWLGSLVVCSPLLYAYQVVTLDLSGQIICTNRPFGDLGRLLQYSCCLFFHRSSSVHDLCPDGYFPSPHTLE